jgi:hypothetical protein
VTLFAPFAMNAIMNDGHIDHQPEPQNEGEDAREVVSAGNEHSKAYVDDDQPHGEADDETNLARD